MLLDSPPIEIAEDLMATVLSNHDSTTPVDTRPRKDPISAPMPAIGDMLMNRWRIIAYAGFGTASVVFRGAHAELAFPVAIKIVNRQHYIDRATVVGHLRNEATILAQLRHSNLSRLWDFHEEDEFPYLVTEFIDGMTMKWAIQAHKRLEPRRVVRAAMHVAEALIATDSAGVIHRDIKPENIVLCNDGSAKLIDFGLAMIQGMENPAAHSEAVDLPRVGTVAYLAPEQARKAANIDGRADIYSLGATMYHAVTGRPPFGGNNAAQVLLRHIEEAPASPSSVVPKLDEDLSNLILRMLAKKPNDRFDDARELLEELKSVQHGLV